MDTVIKQDGRRVHVDCKIFAQLDFSLATSEVSLKDYGHIRQLGRTTGVCAPIMCTRDSSCISGDIRDKQLEPEHLLYVRANSCVDRLLTDASRCKPSFANCPDN